MMKKIYLVIIALFVSISLHAESIDQNEAQSIAVNYIQKKFVSARRAISNTDASLADKGIGHKGNIGYYAFNINGGGFVIVSADSRSPQRVLGYSTTGKYDSEKMPANARWLMNAFALEMTSLDNHPEAIKRSATRRAATAVAPLLGETEWNQLWPYNLQTPVIDGTQAPTGCVATAIAQVMYYHKWPKQGKGKYSYEWEGMTFSADFSQSTYRWDLMLPKYDSNSSKESCEAVALLMHDVGIASNMFYGPGNSGASADYSLPGMIKFFDYDKGIRYIEKDYCSMDSWLGFIQEELTKQRPVIYDGGGSGGAHSMVIDGIDADGLFHVNYGWGGDYNGYFAMGAIGYDMHPSLSFNIKPNEGGEPYPIFCSNSDFLYDKESNMLKMSSWSSVYCPGDREGQFEGALAVERKNSQIVSYVDIGNFDNYQPPTGLEDGEYILYPVGRWVGSQEWQKYYFADKLQTFVDLSVKNGVYEFANNHINDELDEGKIEYNGIYYILDTTTKEATVTYKNEKKNSYSGDVNIPSTFNYEGVEYKVVAIGYEAFYGYSRNLKTIYVPETVKVLDAGCFSCNVENIIFAKNSNIRNISGWAFNGCQIRSLELPEGVETLSYCSFQSCTVENLILPSTVTSIESGAFNYATSLQNLTVKWQQPITNVDETSFENVDLSQVTLHVPMGTTDLYKNAPVWKNFKAIVEDEIVINPITEDVEKTFSQQVDETTDLSNTVIDNTYYNMDAANGDGYSATDGAIVLNSTTSSTQMNAVQGAEVGDAAVRENFSGIIFELPAGQGVITVDAKTIGTHVLNVQIGNGAPTQVKKSERGTAEVEYNVSAPTYVYLYASTESGASARLYRGPSAGVNSVLLYGYKVQVPVTVTAKSYTIKYGDALPKFEYTSEGATIEGTPTISCEATSASPVGTYPIVITKGSVTHYNTTFVNGTLTIEKAPLKITAKSYTIKQGEELPTFEATYEGFKNNETSTVLTKQPAITTTATSASEPGEYEITISGAEAQNYEISYVAGKLTIEAVEIVPISETEEKSFSQQVDETTDLQNTVIGNTYYNMDATNGDGYDATEQALVLNSTTSSTQMSAVQGAQVGDAAVRENFSGIIFEIPAGKGVVTVDAKTIGTHVLNVQIGNGAPTQVKKTERGTVEVEYNVSAPTYVYLYASTESGASARLYRGPSAGANSVLLYGYKVQVGGTGIGELKNGKMEELKYYDLNGRKVKTPRKGVYIINGKKVVVK